MAEDYTYVRRYEQVLIKGRWMGWLPIHHEFWELDNFSSKNYFQIQSEEGRFSKLSWGHAPSNACWARYRVWFTILLDLHFKFWCSIIFVVMYMKDPTKLEPEPPTHLDLFFGYEVYLFSIPLSVWAIPSLFGVLW